MDCLKAEPTSFIYLFVEKEIHIIITQGDVGIGIKSITGRNPHGVAWIFTKWCWPMAVFPVLARSGGNPGIRPAIEMFNLQYNFRAFSYISKLLYTTGRWIATTADILIYSPHLFEYRFCDNKFHCICKIFCWMVLFVIPEMWSPASARWILSSRLTFENYLNFIIPFNITIPLNAKCPMAVFWLQADGWF